MNRLRELLNCNACTFYMVDIANCQTKILIPIKKSVNSYEHSSVTTLLENIIVLKIIF